MTHPQTAFRPRLVAILALFCFLTVACGASLTQVSSERSVDSAGQAPTAADQAAAPDTQPAITNDQAVEIDAPSPPAGGGHNFGVTLAEFSGGQDSGSGPASQASPDATTIEWDDLIPSGSAPAEIFARFEEQLEAVEIGSPESSAIYEQMQAEFDPAAINPDLDGEKIWLAGFVAPLTYTDDNIVTEFLLVPTFGACIHVPPPPPNQTIMVTVDEEYGLTFEEAWGAVWVEGTITLVSASTELGETSYTITNATSGSYNNF